MEGLPGVVHHIGHSEPIFQIKGLFSCNHIGRGFQSQGVHGDGLCLQVQRRLNTALKRRQIVLRQPGDKVHIDMVKTAIPRQRKGVQRLLRRMTATNGLQHLVVKALGVNADPLHAGGSNDLQPLPGDRVRSTGLHCVFHQVRKVKILFNGAENAP